MPTTIAEGRFYQADYIVMTVRLAVRVVKAIWFLPSHKDLLCDTIVLEAMKAALPLAQRPPPDSVG